MKCKVVFYNTWGQRKPEDLALYLSDMKKNVDVFFLTEVTSMVSGTGSGHFYYSNEDADSMRTDGFQYLSTILGNEYGSFFTATEVASHSCKRTGVLHTDVAWGSAIFYRDDLDILSMGEFKILEDSSQRVVQWVVVNETLLAHCHGLWIKGNTKGDHPLRDQQSEELLEGLQQLKARTRAKHVVLGGDFNLDADTRALRRLTSPYKDLYLKRNLIIDLGVTSTRTSEYRHFAESVPLLADYILCTEDLETEGFAVQSEVTASDHAPLLVTVSV